MCKPASFIITKDRAFWSKYSDSHAEIIKEHKLTETRRGSEPPQLCIVKVEINPPTDKDGLPNMIAPLDTWTYHVDEEMAGLELPSWYNPKSAETMARSALVEWHKAKVITTDCDALADGEFWIYGGTINDVRGGTINAVRGGTINAVWGGTINDVWGGTINDVRGGTINDVRGDAVLVTYNGHKPVRMSEYSIFIDRSVNPPVITCGWLVNTKK